MVDLCVCVMHDSHYVCSAVPAFSIALENTY